MEDDGWDDWGEDDKPAVEKSSLKQQHPQPQNECLKKLIAFQLDLADDAVREKINNKLQTITFPVFMNYYRVGAGQVSI